MLVIPYVLAVILGGQAWRPQRPWPRTNGSLGYVGCVLGVNLNTYKNNIYLVAWMMLGASLGRPEMAAIEALEEKIGSLGYMW